MSIYLFQLPLLLFLKKKTAIELSQYIFTSLDMELETLRSKIKLLNQVACVVAS